SFLLASRRLLAIAHQQRTRSWCAADLFRRSTSERAKMLLELFKTHRCEFLAFVWLRHRPAPFRVPSNRPAATTDIAIAPSVTAQSRIMIRWRLFMIAPPELGFRQEIGSLLSLGHLLRPPRNAAPLTALRHSVNGSARTSAYTRSQVAKTAGDRCRRRS